MSDLFLTSKGLEIGEENELPVETGILVLVNDVNGILIKLSVGERQIVKFVTSDIFKAFHLSNEQVTEVLVKYKTTSHIINFDSYNYTIERSLDKAIITIESRDDKEK